MHRDLPKRAFAGVLFFFCHASFASITFSPPAPAGGETVAVTFTEPFNCAAKPPVLTASSAGSFTFVSTLPSGIVQCPQIPYPMPDYSSSSVSLGLLSAGTYTVTWNYYLDQTPDPPRLLSSESASLSVAPGTGTVALSPGFTGNWYSPNSSGHGFSIEVLPGNVLLAEWFVFAPAGGQAWIEAIGPIVANSAVLQAYYPAGAGGRFAPNFDPAQLENKFWGTINFTFSDCNTGQVSWLPAVDAYTLGYTSGSMPITRLTMPAGLSCP
jgi:hypothetical protein